MGNYNYITTKHIERFRIARYVIISPNPESDVMGYMDGWARYSGLLEYPGYEPKRIGWDFPTFSEPLEKMGLRGYVCAYVIPEDFEPKRSGAHISYVEADDYAVITVANPFQNAFEAIPKGYNQINEYIEKNGISAKNRDGRLCFEEIYAENGVTFMDIHVPVDKKK